MLDIASISAVVAALGVITGVVLAIMELRSLVKARQASMFMDLYDHYLVPETAKTLVKMISQKDWKNYDDWYKKYGPEGDLEAYSHWHVMGNYYNGIGMLVSQKLLDIDLVQNLFAQYVVVFWEIYEPVIKGFREQYDFPKAWKWVEYLYNEMQKREQTQQQIQQ